MAISGYESDVFPVYCHVDSDNTKWLMFQRRTDVSDFYLNWTMYVGGFYTPSADNANGTSFWLGLERLYRITSVGAWKLRVDLQSINSASLGNTYNETYSVFAVGNASTNYTLTVGGNISGTAGDSLSHHSGMMFSTFDRDNDLRVSVSCSSSFHGTSHSMLNIFLGFQVSLLN